MDGELQEWPNLVGIDADKAVETIKALHPNLNAIKVPSGSMVTMDYRTDRVRVFYDSYTNLVENNTNLINILKLPLFLIYI